MILIADGGSTKCDWIVVDIEGEHVLEKIRTKGLNPDILPDKELYKILRESTLLEQYKNTVTYVFFYGAGCSSEQSRLTLKKELQYFFTKAQVEVKEDTYAAVYGTINTPTEAAVVCILGTGSNCSYFDGKEIHQKVISLGYMVMDDASGNYFGRKLIRDLYFNKMPKSLKDSFLEKYNMAADFIKYNLYKQSNPNAYLASFAEFIFLNKESEYIKNIILEGIREFSKNMILQFKEEIKTVPVHFTGSVSFFVKEEIEIVAKEMGFILGNVIRHPIDGLVHYHKNNLKNKKR